jgi:putative copper export protein
MSRSVRVVLLTAAVLLMNAPLALAYTGSDDGEGTWGETTDKVVTDAGFILIGGIPLLLLLLSLLQGALEKRKDRRLAANRARAARTDVRGGW